MSDHRRDGTKGHYECYAAPHGERVTYLCPPGRRSSLEIGRMVVGANEGNEGHVGTIQCRSHTGIRGGSPGRSRQYATVRRMNVVDREVTGDKDVGCHDQGFRE